MQSPCLPDALCAATSPRGPLGPQLCGPSSRLANLLPRGTWVQLVTPQTPSHPLRWPLNVLRPTLSVPLRGVQAMCYLGPGSHSWICPLPGPRTGRVCPTDPQALGLGGQAPCRGRPAWTACMTLRSPSLGRRGAGRACSERSLGFRDAGTWRHTRLPPPTCRTPALRLLPRPPVELPGPTPSWGAWRAPSSGGSCRCGSSGRRCSTGTRCSARPCRRRRQGHRFPA